MSDLTEQEKAFWKGATERRKLNAIRLKRLCFSVDAAQVEAFHEIFDVWIARWGKEKTADAIIASMADSEARYQDLKQMVRERKRKKREAKKTENIRR